MHNSKNIIVFPFVFDILNFQDLMTRENIFIYTCIFLNLFYKMNECIFEIYIYSLVILIF